MVILKDGKINPIRGFRTVSAPVNADNIRVDQIRVSQQCLRIPYKSHLFIHYNEIYIDLCH